MATEDRLADLAVGLWGRLRDVLMVAERIETFAFGPETERERGTDGPEQAEPIATDFVLRALRAASDGGNWPILRALAGGDGLTVDEIADRVGVPRLVVTERVSDMLQIGLTARALDSDRVVTTQAGEAIVALVASVAERLAEEVRKGPGGPGRGLPVL